MKKYNLKLKISPKWFAKGIKFRKAIDSQIRKDSKGLINHFKKDKWDVDTVIYIEDALDVVVGRNVLSYIKAKHLELLTKKFPKACISYKYGYCQLLDWK
jgi:chemotaxis methyl-accepting protein methylase